jgi:hypothetical protein
MKISLSLILAFLCPSIIAPIPAGQQNVDATGNNGVTGLWSNINNYAESLSSLATSGTTATLIASGQNAIQSPAPPSGNILAGFTMLNAGFTGTGTVTLPSTAAIIAALGPSVPLDGSYSEPVHIMNNTGQTLSLAAGDSNTQILGSTSTVTGNVRKLLLRVLNSANVTFTNVGTWTF